ncbi:MAG: TrmB family transcriptional regulator [Candidatus Moraniibacteriota bacterium]|jgi:HTH-type transcriptional regulator, sugar sensing transcriptional regulator
MNKLYKELKIFGLTEYESLVYMALLETGEANIAQLTKKSGVNRSTVYLAIESLKKKGLISSVKKRKTLFYAEDPRKMIDNLERQKEKLEKVMPSFLAIFALLDKKPDIRFFEGEEGIKEIYKDILKTSNQEMLAWYSNDYKEFFDKSFFFDFFIPERKKNKIWLRAIYPENESMRNLASNNVESLRQTRFIKNDKFNIECEICLYENNKIGIVSYKDEFGIIIASQSIFNTLKSIFEVMWDGGSE